MNTPTVDIIIPAYKPDIKFEKLIRGLKRQSYPIQNIFIIHTKGGRFPWEAVGPDSKVTVKEIEKEAFDHGGTRRMAAGLSKADIFICMTQDAVPADRDLILHLSEAFKDDKVACAYARQLPDEKCDVIERYTRSFNYPAEGCIKDLNSVDKIGVKAFFCSNVCAAYRRTYYDELGGFVKKAIFNEDMIMAGRMLKAGYSCVYASEAKVIHSHNYSCIQQFKRNFDVAVSQVDNPDIFGGIKSESEGIRLVRDTAGYLIKIRSPWLIMPLVIKSGFKYLGYKLGQRYKHLPQRLVVKLSSNPKYWN
ncbi:cellulose synthase catalytic subunit [[Eubacterium] contortum]|uniref:Cellulose synthase catalytic subunit n=1 Tax=Faecalicatena contorta TaxID=39482 RepID=A0A174EXD9_9FIRM|nr:glycosyltransferase family 2 protein [Faecalicatena contorta]MBS6764212.1 glycosyltransferase family 2 protein [Clostridium sp.]CUO42633.1 cellulose synthase catalytic subunit [[Eubacterium] contortum] [Faecalicatena contorta]